MPQSRSPAQVRDFFNMAQFSFELPTHWPSDPRALLERAWIAGGYEGAPVPVRRRHDDRLLVLVRDEDESGNLSVPWPVRGESRIISTSTLRVRPEPYRLALELARGCVNRARNLYFALTSASIPMAAILKGDLAEISRAFGRAALTDDPAVRDAHAFVVIEAASLLADRLTGALTKFRIDARMGAKKPLPTLLGCRLSAPLSPAESEDYARCFNAVRIVPNWKQIEREEANFNWSQLDPLVRWASAAGLAISMGPLVDLSGDTVPDWILASTGDFPNLAALYTDFAGTLVARYRDRCRHWELFSGFNHRDALGLGEDDRLRLAARLLETAADVDAGASWTFGLRQPFGDYLLDPRLRYSPFGFADTLLRTGFEVSALELELTPDSGPGGGLPRDPLDVLQLLELYDPLNCPLDITLAAPLAGDSAMALATVETLIGSPSVRAVYWDVWSAGQPHAATPGAELYPTSLDRPALGWFLEVRKGWLR